MIRLRLVFRLVTLGVLLIGIGSMVQKYIAPKPENTNTKIAWMEANLNFLFTQIRIQRKSLKTMDTQIVSENFYADNMSPRIDPLTGQNYVAIEGSRAAMGLLRSERKPLQMPLSNQPLPKCLQRPDAVIIPAYHMHRSRGPVNIVMGVPSVKRDKESYLLVTLTHLVKQLTAEDASNTLIVVFVGETDLQYVLDVASSVEESFPTEVEMGLIEVLSPAKSYYPDMTVIKPTLGDSYKRARWRTKQNLDAIYLMTYAQSKGVYYLMLEDDVITKERFSMVKDFLLEVSSSTPKWEIISFSEIGGIGKLFRGSTLFPFINYLELFHTNMPIDWLIEMYVNSRACGLDFTQKTCKLMKGKLYPRYNGSLFSHIGLFSSLKGKIHKINDVTSKKAKKFYAHLNPPAKVKTDIKTYSRHTLEDAYMGVDYFWGIRPKKGSYMDFVFEKPTHLKSFFFRTANPDHPHDKLHDTEVLALQAIEGATFITVGTFDEFGMVEEDLTIDFGPVHTLRLLINATMENWVVLSEIQLDAVLDTTARPKVNFISVETYNKREEENRKLEDIRPFSPPKAMIRRQLN